MPRTSFPRPSASSGGTTSGAGSSMRPTPSWWARRRLSRRGLVSADRLCLVPHSRGPRHPRVALLLVPEVRCGLHQAGGRVRAFLAESSFQLTGYASYLIPAALGILGWHYFWCRKFDAAYTKLVGASLLVGCLSSLLHLAFGTVDVLGKPFRAGGYVGEWLASLMSESLTRTGSIIVILTVLFLPIILSTQFSIGPMFSSAAAVGRH